MGAQVNAYLNSACRSIWYGSGTSQVALQVGSCWCLIRCSRELKASQHCHTLLRLIWIGYVAKGLTHSLPPRRYSGQALMSLTHVLTLMVHARLLPSVNNQQQQRFTVPVAFSDILKASEKTILFVDCDAVVCYRKAKWEHTIWGINSED